MNSVFKYFTDIYSAVRSLWAGMRVTGKYFLSPGEIVTEQYPENRATLKMEERFKGEVIMTHDENNQHNCNGCGICELETLSRATYWRLRWAAFTIALISSSL